MFSIVLISSLQISSLNFSIETLKNFLNFQVNVMLSVLQFKEFLKRSPAHKGDFHKCTKCQKLTKGISLGIKHEVWHEWTHLWTTYVSFESQFLCFPCVCLFSHFHNLISFLCFAVGYRPYLFRDL